MATPSCEDADTIARRVAELRQEDLDNLNCRCRHPDGGGEVDRSGCAVHGGAAPVGLVICGTRHPLTDDILLASRVLLAALRTKP